MKHFFNFNIFTLINKLNGLAKINKRNENVDCVKVWADS